MNVFHEGILQSSDVHLSSGDASQCFEDGSESGPMLLTEQCLDSSRHSRKHAIQESRQTSDGPTLAACEGHVFVFEGRAIFGKS